MTTEQITQIVASATPEQAASLLEAVQAELAPLQQAQTDLQIANERIATLTADLKKYEGTDATITGLQEKIAQYEQEAKERNLLTAFDAAVGGKTFVNEYTKTALFEQVKTEMAKEANAGKGVGEIFSTLIEGKQDIFTPEISVPRMAGSSTVSVDQTADIRKIMGL